MDATVSVDSSRDNSQPLSDSSIIPSLASSTPLTAYQLNARIHNSETYPVDPSLGTFGSVNDDESSLGDAADGAYTRKWFNQEITPVLLEGMRFLAREKPVDPLKALGSFLLEKACERLKEEQEHYKQEDLAAQLENNVNGTEQLYGNDQKENGNGDDKPPSPKRQKTES